MSRRVSSSNTSSFSMLNRSEIKSIRQLDINDTMNTLDLQKRRNYTLNKDIRDETAKIDFFTKKIELFEKEIEQILNKKKYNKTLSVNNPAMVSTSATQILVINRYIQQFKQEIKEAKKKIQTFKKGNQNANDEINRLRNILRVKHLSVGGRTKRTRKRRKTLKKK
jgi:hypothetical protein